MQIDNTKMSKLLQGSDEDIDIALIIIQKYCKEEGLNWVTYYKSLLPIQNTEHTQVNLYTKVFRRAFKHIKINVNE